MDLLYILDMIGTGAFAASGAFAGIRRGMDLLGVLVLGLVTATGGGTIRDILLGDFPPFCLKDESYLYLSILVGILVFALHRRMGFIRYPLLYFDAIGLGTFVVIGTTKAIDFQLGGLSAVLLGTMTATAGGVLRDILSSRVPLILRREIYATCCLAGGAMLVGLHNVGAPVILSSVLAAVLVILIRLLAIQYDWALPRARSVE